MIKQKLTTQRVYHFYHELDAMTYIGDLSQILNAIEQRLKNTRNRETILINIIRDDELILETNHYSGGQ